MMARAARTIPVTFTAEGGAGPLIWGQRAMWDVLRQLPPGDTSTNMAMSVEVPPGTELEAVAEALRQLVQRHDVLRTTFHDEPPGVTQRVHPTGVLHLAVHDCSGDLTTEVAACRARLRAGHFDVAADLPLRPAVLVRDGRPAALVVAVSHLAVDGWSKGILQEDLATLLTDPGKLPPAGRQPLARAAYEASEAMRLAADRALRYWESRIRELPAEMLRRLPGDGPTQPDWARLTSHAAARAVPVIAERHRLSDSTAVQAVTGLLLASWLGLTQAGLRLILSTRFAPEDERLTAAFNQNGLLRLVVRDEPLGEFLDRAGTAALGALRNCQYPPDELETRIARICAERGLEPGGFCFFNDVRPTTAVHHRGGPRPDAVALREALDDSTVEVADLDDNPTGSRFFMFLDELTDERLVATLGTDPGLGGPAFPQRFLAALDRLLVIAATTPRRGADEAAREACESIPRSGP